MIENRVHDRRNEEAGQEQCPAFGRVLTGQRVIHDCKDRRCPAVHDGSPKTADDPGSQ
jgi:hypothetical protein